MVVYPILGQALGMDDRTLGIMLGLTIHDVAQVVGAGFSVSDESGNTATLIKLFRVSLLVPILVIISLLLHRGNKASNNVAGNRAGYFPWFIVGFALAIIINSLGILPGIVHSLLSALSGWLLVTGIVAIGIKTSLESLKEVRPVAMIIVSIETLFLLAIVSLVLLFLIPS